MNDELEILLRRQTTIEPSAGLDRLVRETLRRAKPATRHRSAGWLALIAPPAAVAAAVLAVVAWWGSEQVPDSARPTEIAQPQEDASNDSSWRESPVVASLSETGADEAGDAGGRLRVQVSQNMGYDEGIMRLKDDAPLRWVRVRTFEQGVIYEPEDNLTIRYRLPVEHVVFSPVVTY